MAFFKVNTNEDDIRDYTGGNSKYINDSGMYPVIIKHVIADTTAKGSEYVNLWIEYEGQLQPIYQAIRLTNNDGSPNFGRPLFNKLCIIAGCTENDEVDDPVEMKVPMGKGGEEVDCMVLEQFNDFPVIMRIQMEYRLYEGKIQETKIIRNFFRYEDKATASEIVNDSDEKGKQYNIELESADKVIYKDDLTKEDIDAWKQSRRSDKKEDTSKKPSGGFGQKRTFGKK